MSSSEPVHVLVVDDDRHVQRMLGDALRGAGFSVTVERDGESALKAFERRAFDVVVLDVLLPLLNGYEVARRIKSTPTGAQVPVLMISGIYKSKTQALEAVERHGAAAFVEKPFKLGALFAKLKDVLQERYPTPPPPPPTAVPEPARPDPLADERAQAEAAQVESAAAPAAAARGDFTEAPFAEVLAALHRQGASGALLLRREKVKKIIYFRRGVPVSVKSNRLSECLGRVMVREGMLSEVDCGASLERMKASGRQQGTVLIEMGVISPHNLRYALDLQLRLKLMDVFSWLTGEWQFNPSLEPPPDTVRLELSPAAIIHEGVRRGFDAARLRARLGDVSPQVVWPTDDPLFAGQDMGLGEEELQLLAKMDGSRTVAELRELALLPPLDTDRLLYALLAAQMVQLRAERREVPVTEAPTVSAVEGVTEEIPQGSDDGEEPLELEDEVTEDEDSATRERLLGTLAAMKRMDYFELLGVRSEATPEEVRRAHAELVREYHLDKFVGSSSAEVRELALAVQELLAAAGDALADPARRDEYRAKLGSGGVRHEVGEAVGRMLQAESTFRRGQQLLSAGDVAGARPLFEEAVRLQPEEGEFVAYLGWSRFQEKPGVPEEAQIARAALERAVELSPTLEKAHLFLGYVQKALGRPEEATRAFERALECNPSSAEALRELSILSWAVRLQKGTGKRGGL